MDRASDDKDLPLTFGTNRAGEGGFLRFSDFEAFENSRFCFWVYDFDRQRVVWANRPALWLWSATDLPTLAGRDLGKDMSASVRSRLEQFRIDVAKGATFDEVWTLYPEGRPQQVLCRFRGCLLPDGRTAMLCEGSPVEVQNEEVIRTSQALLFTDAMVSIYSRAGACLYGNPAARRSFDVAFPNLAGRIMNPDLITRLLDASRPVEEGRHVSMVRTLNGFRLHEIELRNCSDPISGRPAILLTEIDITEQEETKARLAYLAEHDPLTGLGNRSLLEARADQIIAAAQRAGEVVQVLVFDMNRFKLINDALGHAAGDRFLAAVARRLTSALPKGSLAVRMGGDEFCVLVTRPADSARDLRLARTLEKGMSRPIVIDGHSLSLRASIGIALAPTQAGDLAGLLRRADLALAQAKKRQDQEPLIFDPKMEEEGQRFLAMDREIRKALRAHRFEVAYQPRVCVATGRIMGAEALLRMRGADGALISPQRVIPVAEATGTILPIGRWVIRTVAEDIRLLAEAGIDTRISVNVSPRQFLDPALVPLLRRVRAALPGGPTQMELEITESMLTSDDARARRNIERLVELGMPLSVDDFGTAYSNITSLKRFPIHCLKIDRSIILDSSAELLASGIVTIARSIGASVVAEGVESPTQLDMLRRIGCEAYQGFLYSEPVGREKLAALFRAEGG